MRLAEELGSHGRELLRRAGLAGAPRELVGALVCVAVAALVWAGWRWWPRTESTPSAGVAAAVTKDGVSGRGSVDSTFSAPPAKVFVHVVGAVRHPGVYELAVGSRVSDAVDAAGGLMPDAVAAAVNLARVVTDGEQIAVPDADEVASDSSTSSGGKGGAGSASAAQPAAIDINSADEVALDALPGIGPATAKRIVADREANGPFASVEDLGRVSGIGPKKLEQLTGLICVR